MIFRYRQTLHHNIYIITVITIWLQAWNVNWETGHMMVQLGTGENVIFQVGLHIFIGVIIVVITIKTSL